jgi:hypothetical protein
LDVNNALGIVESNATHASVSRNDELQATLLRREQFKRLRNVQLHFLGVALVHNHAVGAQTAVVLIQLVDGLNVTEIGRAHV